MVCYIVICIQKQCIFHLCCAHCRLAIFDIRIEFLTQFKEGFFLKNRGKYGPPTGGIWVVG